MYWAPEIIDANATHKDIDLEKSDIFSFGVMAFRLIYGVRPFKQKATFKDFFY